MLQAGSEVRAAERRRRGSPRAQPGCSVCMGSGEDPRPAHWRGANGVRVTRADGQTLALGPLLQNVAVRDETADW